MILRRSLPVLTALNLLLAGPGAIAAPGEPPAPPQPPAAPTNGPVPFEFGKPVPLNLSSSGVEWKGHTYQLLRLNSARFDLDRQTGLLKAEVKAGVTSFDDVEYDVSAAVFDARGRLLGTARAQCKVERIWLGHVMMMARDISLDFGLSLDYESATSFLIAISKRNVLTPDAWQK